MKKYLLLFVFFLSVVAIAARPVSNIERNGSWYYVYDDRGKKAKTLSVSSVGELIGYSSSLVIFRKGSFYHLYDSDLKKITTMSVSSCGEVISVAGDTFTTRKGSWIYTFNSKGKKLNTRPAHR